MASGCTTITPEAQRVALYSQYSALLATCKRLGPVSSDVSLWSVPTAQAGVNQASNNLRDMAFRQHGADAVAVVNVDRYIDSVSVQGMALKCNP